MKKNIGIRSVLVLFILLTICGCSNDDYLILVNKNNLISEKDIDESKLVETDDCFEGTTKINKTALEAYEKLKADLADNDGIEIGIDNCYRSIEEQEETMNVYIAKYGEEYARKTVAEPGTSDHHTGLAVDIVIKKDGNWVIENEDLSKLEDEFAIIHSKLSKYGYILRYPDGKKNITGYDYQPWTIRYVGEKAAQDIYSNNLTLEEYLNK